MNKKIEYIIPMRFILEAFARRDFYLQHTVEKDVISTLPLFIFSEISQLRAYFTLPLQSQRSRVEWREIDASNKI